MAFAPNFDKHLKRGLAEKAPDFEWETGWSAEGQRWKVDVAGLSKNGTPRRILIEVELKKDNPVENVVKIWRWAKEEKKTERILFLQAFSAHYTKTKKRTHKVTKRKQYDRSIFVGERMMEDRSSGLRIGYKSIPMEYAPRMGRDGIRIKEGAGCMRDAAHILAKKVARLVHLTQATRS
jgi:hypothetical protein